MKFPQKRKKVVIGLREALDGSSASELERVLKRISRRCQGADLIFDFSETRKFEYFGVVILAKVIRKHKNYFRKVMLTGMQTSGQNLFKRFGVESFGGGKKALLP